MDTWQENLQASWIEERENKPTGLFLVLPGLATLLRSGRAGEETPNCVLVVALSGPPSALSKIAGPER